MFLIHYHGNNHFQSSQNPLNQESWHEQDEMAVLYCGNLKNSWKTSITSSWREKYSFAIIIPLLSLSYILSQNSHVLLYFNGLNPCIEHLDMFWNIWNLILWKETGNKWSSCYDYSKYEAFILGQSEQQLKNNIPFLNLRSSNGIGTMILWHIIKSS